MRLHHPPCVCPSPGYCRRYRRHVLGNAHAVCQAHDDAGRAESRAMLLEGWRRSAERMPSASRDAPCVHLGPATGELRDCETCSGRVREKVHGCAVHTTTTMRDCRRCKDYHAPADDPGGMGEAAHADDHYALSFARGATMSLHDAEGRAVRSMEGRFSGGMAFLLNGGPSLVNVPLERLRNHVTIAVNNVIEVYPRPSVWVAVDDPTRFPSVPWHSPETVKLVPRAWAGVDLPDGTPIAECPSTLFFLRNGCFRPRLFLAERSICWGNERPWGSGRSVLLVAIRLAFYLGVRKLVLLGTDFRMDAARPYAHSEPKSDVACASNNSKFEILGRRLAMLRPILEAAGMTVVNATEGSHLEAFERVRLDEELSRDQAT